MRYVAAYLLAVLGGNTSPSAKDLKKILSSVGVDAEDSNLKKVIDELSGKDVDEVLAAGRFRVITFPEFEGGGNFNFQILIIKLGNYFF